jgi:hypothetical protein
VKMLARKSRRCRQTPKMSGANKRGRKWEDESQDSSCRLIGHQNKGARHTKGGSGFLPASLSQRFGGQLAMNPDGVSTSPSRQRGRKRGNVGKALGRPWARWQKVRYL